MISLQTGEHIGQAVRIEVPLLAIRPESNRAVSCAHREQSPITVIAAGVAGLEQHLTPLRFQADASLQNRNTRPATQLLHVETGPQISDSAAADLNLKESRRVVSDAEKSFATPQCYMAGT
jgi:hypothetical protein